MNDIDIITAVDRQEFGAVLLRDQQQYYEDRLRLPVGQSPATLPSSSMVTFSRGGVARSQQSTTTSGPLLSLSKWVPWQRQLSATSVVGHSESTRHLADILEFTDILSGYC